MIAGTMWEEGEVKVRGDGGNSRSREILVHVYMAHSHAPLIPHKHIAVHKSLTKSQWGSRCKVLGAYLLIKYSFQTF